MRLIDADTAQVGLTVLAGRQTHGKGQRGNIWTDDPFHNVLMSIVISPVHTLANQFVYNACVAGAIARVLQNLCENTDVRIKWPNDIILNDKKAGGVLIENVLRGNTWQYSIIGFGLNVNQQEFPTSLRHATSLRLESGKEYQVDVLAAKLREEMLRSIYCDTAVKDIMEDYNEYLFRRFETQAFTDGKDVWNVTVLQALQDGRLEVQHDDGFISSYTHGVTNWKW